MKIYIQVSHFDPCKEREIGQIVSLLRQPITNSDHNPSYEKRQFGIIDQSGVVDHSPEGQIIPQGMFAGQDPLIGGGETVDGGISPNPHPLPQYHHHHHLHGLLLDQQHQQLTGDPTTVYSSLINDKQRDSAGAYPFPSICPIMVYRIPSIFQSRNFRGAKKFNRVLHPMVFRC